MPTWRADYFDNLKDNAPSRSEIIVAENGSDALHEARSKMGSLCSRAEAISLAHCQPAEPSRLRSVAYIAVSQKESTPIAPAPVEIPAGAHSSQGSDIK